MRNDYKKLVKYWQETAAYDYDTMKSLVKSQRYASSLFFGHIVLEKILKALKYTENYIEKINKLYKKLCQKLKPGK